MQNVEHLEGGIVAKILVKNGDVVKKGQLLVQFDPTATKAELAQLRSREITYLLNAQRLRAFINSEPADTTKWAEAVVNSKYNTVKNKAQIQQLLEDEKAQLTTQNKNRVEQKHILQVALERRKEQLQQAIQQKAVRDKHVELLTEEFNMYKKLKTGNYVSHKDYLTVLRELNKAKGESSRFASDIEQFQQQVKEDDLKLQELDSNTRKSAQVELADTSDAMLEVRHQIEKFEDRLQRMDIKSPIDGTVKGLDILVGNVAESGGKLMEIVPTGGLLVAESRVQPRDIGHKAKLQREAEQQ